MKKRKIKRAVAGAMALLMMINALPVTDGWFHPMTSYASTARANATSLNVRSGPGTTYSIAGKLTNGKTVTVLGQTTGSDGKTWSQIRFTGTGGAEITGYVLSTYLKNPTSYSHDGNFESYLTSQGFPESYKDGLRLLHAEYPNWVFTAQHTNLDWNTVIENESVVGRNLVYTSSISSWKSIADGAYNWDTSTWPGFDSSSYVAASSDIIKYYMDPRNFLDGRGIFQFESLEYNKISHTQSGVESILKNTPMYNKTFSYPDDVTNTTKSMKYSQAFMAAADTSGVSPYHLASRVKQEVVISPTTMSDSVSGTRSGYTGIYNFYNIGATNTTSGSAVNNGLKWASTGNSYLRPWNSRYRSIVGGAIYIGEKYINVGQNTSYLQKFNVTEKNRYNHQYMSNIEAPNSEATKTASAYSATLNEMTLVFSIPVYTNMPEEVSPIPTK